MPRLYNKYHKDAPADAVYIGRGSPWGNHFVMGVDGTREEVIAQYEDWLKRYADQTFLRMMRKRLKGKDLVCFCYPKPCHGDIILRLVNET